MNFIERTARLIAFTWFLIFRTTIALVGLVIFRKKPEFFDIQAKKWATSALKALGTNVIVKGKENIKKDESYIFIANHTNLLDIVILLHAIPQPIHFVYRKSLEKVPILGIALKLSPFIPIVRESNNNASAAINRAVNALEQNASIIIFPEGTRNYNGVLNGFKRGAFVIAERTNKPIVPVCVRGVWNITPQKKGFALNKGNVEVFINKPAEKYPSERLEQLDYIKKLQIEMQKQVANG